MSTLSSSRARDAALHRLSRCNRWLLAGSVTLTGAFTAIAAQAFPGKTHTSTAAKGTGASGKTTQSRHLAKHAVHKSSPTKALAAPAQAPEAQTTTTEQTTTPTETPQTTEAPTSPESSSESSSAPVVSGGS